MSPRAIPASEAKARFSELLHDVERGAKITITRHGRPVAHIGPEPSQTEGAQGMNGIIAGIRERRKHRPPMTVEELLSARDEGRRS